MASSGFRDEHHHRRDHPRNIELVTFRQMPAHQLAHLRVTWRRRPRRPSQVGDVRGAAHDGLPIFGISTIARRLVILAICVGDQGEPGEIDMGGVRDRSRVGGRDVSDEIVRAIPVEENVVRTQVEVGEVVGDPQQRNVGQLVAGQVDWLPIVIVHPKMSSCHWVRLGAHVDATQRPQFLWQQTVDDEDRFTVDEPEPRALCAKPRCGCFTRRRKPLDVDMVIDGEKAGDVVRHFRPELLESPHRPLAGGQGSQHVGLCAVVEHEATNFPLGQQVTVRLSRIGELACRAGHNGSLDGHRRKDLSLPIARSAPSPYPSDAAAGIRQPTFTVATSHRTNGLTAR